MSDAWVVRSYRHGDRDKVLKFLGTFNKMWKGVRGRQLWEWYHENPYGYVAGVSENTHNNVVGFIALVPNHIQLLARTEIGSVCVDLLVHPDCRRQGMFVSLGRLLVRVAKKDKIALWLGFPNYRAHHGHLRYGWFDVAPMPILQRYVSLKGLVLSRSIVPRLRHIYHALFGRKQKQDARIDVQPIDVFGCDVDELWESVSPSYDVVVARTCQYLNWRYINKPQSGYRVFVAKKNDRLVGYVVLTVKTTHRKRVGYIVDIFAIPEIAIVRQLVRRSVAYLKEQRVDVVICGLLERREWYQAFRDNGFVQSRTVPLIARINTDAIRRKTIDHVDHWHITLGDGDV